MPTYSYACTECDDRFDAVQAFSDASLTTCGKCNGRLRKLFGNVGVVFKGSGFYRTDSRESAKSSSNGSGNGSSGASGSSPSSDKSSSDKSSAGSSSSSDSGKSSSSSTSPAAAAASS
ncbi:FmdB family zinc ribbon protein [Mycolicibacterium celeriflavum]|uniref:FmdB family zinc ribbon protein n=1 Tax=Mycolicibacterium celeriflavum TaxID=1249101 RepID=UPI0009F55D6C|nr:FmdB family zinc ribbon protein [Mycolicibacterium celeriflavum]MCV7237416.1 FmdB family transcriptional regulator [Mycolicibacterium celeriflavum]ORA46056.1 FmdB family transcriptional regulator [Mycolicibacterium celeriflavum]